MKVKRKSSDSQDGEEATPAKIQRDSKKGEVKKPERPSKLTKTKTPKPGLKKNKFNSKLKSDKARLLAKSGAKKSSGEEKKLEKPNWTKLKEEKKELRKKRKEQKCPFFDLTCKTKKLWEKMRRADCVPSERDKLSREIYSLVKGSLSKVVFTHDISRVIQWLLKVASSDVKQNIVEELKSSVPSMLESKYAGFCVKSMLKHGNANSKRTIVNSLCGKVVKLISHSVAAPMFETIYSEWTTAKERSLLQQELYGAMYKQDKDSKIASLEDALKTPGMKEAVLSAVKSNVTHILDKKLGKSSLLHSVLLDFLKFCSNEDREEVCQQIQENLLDFTGTKCGAHIAVLCICQAKNKQKKSIMKTLKGHVMEIAKLEYGHLVLLSLFDTVDDTVLLKKLLMPELSCDLLGLVNNEYGRKVLLYLVAHRDPHYFHPSDIALLDEGLALSTSKKDMKTRIGEIQEAVLDPLLEAIANDPRFWMSSSSIEMVTLAVLKCGTGGEAKKAFEAIADYVCDPDGKITENEKEISVMEHSGTHMMLKKLIQHDSEKASQDQVTFSSVLASKLSDEILSSWVRCNRSCFVLVFLMESKLSAVVEEVFNKLQDLTDVVKAETSPGAKVLHKKLVQNSKNEEGSNK